MAKRSRAGYEMERVSRASFVESMLYAVADTLAHDSEYGNNPANRIRREVEKIAQTVSSGTDGISTEGRAVLDARFALGHDDAQYLSQAVSMLWAGDGGERLRLIPKEVLPTVLNRASAAGLVNAMESVIEHKNESGKRQLTKSVELSAFLMSIDEVRAAVTDYMTSAGNAAVGRIAAEINASYATNPHTGKQRVMDLRLAQDDDDELFAASVMFEALYVISSPDYGPGHVLQSLVNEVKRLVGQAASDSALVVELAACVGKINNVWLPSQVDINRANERSTTFCPRYDTRDRQSFGLLARPSEAEFKTAVIESLERIGGFNASLPPDEGSNVEAGGDSKPWKLHRVMSPLWNQGPPGKRFTEGRLSTNGFAQMTEGEMTPESVDYTRKTLADLLETPETVQLEVASGPYRANRLINEMQDFCMLRGVCGYKGPHQNDSSDPSDKKLAYNFPGAGLNKYTQGEMKSADTADVSSSMARDVAEAQSKVYGDGLNVKYSTDFVGRVVSSTGRAAEKEQPRGVRWAPLNKDNTAEGDGDDEIITDELSQDICEAAVYEFMAQSLLLDATTLYSVSKELEPQKRLLTAAAAAAKIHQLSSMISIRNASLGDSQMLLTPTKDSPVAYVTRPAFRCPSSTLDSTLASSKRILLPVDAGIARFDYRPGDASAPLVPLLITGDDSDESDTLTGFGRSAITNVALTNWLQKGVTEGPVSDDPDAPDYNTARDRFSFFVGTDVQHAPFDNSKVEESTFNVGGIAQGLDHEDFDAAHICNAAAQSMITISELQQLYHESVYVSKFKTNDSIEKKEIMGLGTSAEDAARDRRTAVWSDALREVAISGDRLYRFVTLLTGSIGESADSAISWEDEDMRATSKEALARQRELAERVSRFQTKLVENVVSSTLKASKLQLDVRSQKGSAMDQLVVLSSDVRDNIRQLTSGDAGHGFFEASVELNNVLGAASKPIAIRDLVKQLQSVTQEFQEQVSSQLGNVGTASYGRLVEPRNSYMLHLKPDTTAAIQKAFDHITSEMANCYTHRHVHLWEYVEGKDHMMCARFAELVGLVLQNTRMRSGSFAAYVGQSQLLANCQNIRMQINRLRTQVCHYLKDAFDVPSFTSPHDGRIRYFGGSLSDAGEKDAVDARKKRRLAEPSFGGDDDGGAYPARPRPIFKYNARAERRMREVGRAVRSAVLNAKTPRERKEAAGLAPSASSISTAFFLRPLAASDPRAAPGDIASSLARTNPATGTSTGTAAVSAINALDRSVKANPQNGIRAAAVLAAQSASPYRFCDDFKNSENEDDMLRDAICTELRKQNYTEGVYFAGQQKRLHFKLKRSEQLKGNTFILKDRPTGHWVVRNLKLDVFKTSEKAEFREDVKQIKRVAKALNDLFVMTDGQEGETLYDWQPHPMWASMTQTDEYANTWVRMRSRNDTEWRSSLLQMAEATYDASVTLKIPYRMILKSTVALGFVALLGGAAYANTDLASAGRGLTNTMDARFPFGGTSAFNSYVWDARPAEAAASYMGPMNADLLEVLIANKTVDVENKKTSDASEETINEAIAELDSLKKTKEAAVKGEPVDPSMVARVSDPKVREEARKLSEAYMKDHSAFSQAGDVIDGGLNIAKEYTKDSVKLSDEQFTAKLREMFPGADVSKPFKISETIFNDRLADVQRRKDARVDELKKAGGSQGRDAELEKLRADESYLIDELSLLDSKTTTFLGLVRNRRFLEAASYSLDRLVNDYEDAGVRVFLELPTVDRDEFYGLVRAEFVEATKQVVDMRANIAELTKEQTQQIISSFKSFGFATAPATDEEIEAVRSALKNTDVIALGRAFLKRFVQEAAVRSVSGSHSPPVPADDDNDDDVPELEGF